MPDRPKRFREKVRLATEKVFPLEKVLPAMLQAEIDRIQTANALKQRIISAILKGFADTRSLKDLGVKEKEMKAIYENVVARIGTQLLIDHGIRNYQDLMRKIGLGTIYEQKWFLYYKKLSESSLPKDKKKFIEMVWDFADEPYAKEMILKFYRDNPDEDYNTSFYLHCFSQTWGEEFCNLVIKLDKGREMFTNLVTIKNHHAVEKYLLQLAPHAGYEPLYKFSWYKHLPNAEKIFRIGIVKSLDWIIYALKDYIEENWANSFLQDFIPRLSKRRKSDLFEKLVHQSEKFPWVKDRLFQLAPFIPETVFENFRFFSGFDWSEGLLLTAAPNDRDRVKRTLDNFREGRPFYKVFKEHLVNNFFPGKLKKKFLKAAKTDPHGAFYYFEGYRSLIKNPEDVLLAVASNSFNGGIVLSHFNIFKDEPCAYKVISTVCRGNYNFFIGHIPMILTLPNDVKKKLFFEVKDWSGAKPPLAKKFNLYASEPWAYDLLFSIADDEYVRGHIFRRIHIFDNFDDDKRYYLLKKASSINDDMLLIYHENYKTNKDVDDLVELGLNRFINQGRIFDTSHVARVLSSVKDPVLRKKIADKVAIARLVSFGNHDELKTALKRNIAVTKARGSGIKSDQIEKVLLFGLLHDRSLRENFFKIKSEWLTPKPKNKFMNVQFRIMIARNLFRRNEVVTKKSSMEAYKRVLEWRKKNRKKPLFRGHDIVYMADGKDRMSGGTDYECGSKATIAAIRKQGGRLPDDNIIRTKEDLSDYKAKKKKLVSHIINKPGPLTVIVDCHGGEKNLCFTNADFKGIDYKELGGAFVERAKKYPNESDRPIIVFTSCNALPLAYRMNEFIRSKGKPIPTSLTSSEYKMLSYGETNKYGSLFWQRILDPKVIKKLGYTSFGTVADNEDGGNNNPTWITGRGGAQTQLLRHVITTNP